jgi:hypothetical protein
MTNAVVGSTARVAEEDVLWKLESICKRRSAVACAPGAAAGAHPEPRELRHYLLVSLALRHIPTFITDQTATYRIVFGVYILRISLSRARPTITQST